MFAVFRLFNTLTFPIRAVIDVTLSAKVMHHSPQRQRKAGANGVFIYINGPFTASIKAQFEANEVEWSK